MLYFSKEISIPGFHRLQNTGNFHSWFPASTEYNLTVTSFVIRGATKTRLEGGIKEFRFCATKQELYVWLQGEAPGISTGITQVEAPGARCCHYRG